MKRAILIIALVLASCVRAVELAPADAFVPPPDGDGSGTGSGFPDALVDDGGFTPDAAIAPPVDANAQPIDAAFK